LYQVCKSYPPFFLFKVRSALQILLDLKWKQSIQATDRVQFWSIISWRFILFIYEIITKDGIGFYTSDKNLN
jgi:hypothetical protein